MSEMRRRLVACRSGSSYGQALALMKHSISSLIETLDIDDFVNVANVSYQHRIGCLKLLSNIAIHKWRIIKPHCNRHEEIRCVLCQNARNLKVEMEKVLVWNLLHFPFPQSFHFSFHLCFDPSFSPLPFVFLPCPGSPPQI